MKWRERSVQDLARAICGDDPFKDAFRYRSSSLLTEFFRDCDLEYIHDGTTRRHWVSDKIKEVISLPSINASSLPDALMLIIRALLNKADAQPGDPERTQALGQLNAILQREGWEAFYDERGEVQLRNTSTNAIAQAINPHRPLTPAEVDKKSRLTAYLKKCTEDDLIEEVILPLFRQLGFHRITAAGHKDKSLEYGKDVWMKYTLPTLHVIYFGIQAKKGKIDSAGVGREGSTNVSEIHNQACMMLGHEIFDSELNRRVLVDHAFIISGGEITKQARNWLGERLDAVKRSQIMFMDRDDILNLFTVTNLPLPRGALPDQDESLLDGDIPF